MSRKLPLLLALALAAPAAAQVPETLSVQGRITDSGQPVTGAQSIDVKIYTVPSGGTALHSETDAVTFDDNGTFVTTLGDGPSLDKNLFDQQLYVGFALTGQSELADRIPIASSPSALRAVRAEGRGGELPAISPTPTIVLGTSTAAQSIAPTSRYNFLQTSQDTHKTCIGRIEPWSGIQNGDKITFLSDATPETNFTHFVDAQGEVKQCASQTCGSGLTCNIRGFSNIPFNSGVSRILQAEWEAITFTYLDGHFYHDP